jgi:hypothetical protein
VSWLSSAFIDPAVHELFPDYRASLVLAENLQPGPSDEVSEKLLADAESRYRGEASWDEHPHIAAWRAAFRALGSKPQRFRPSVDALLRRVPDGLPRINRLTDVYNAVSIAHVVPVGGEDVAAYRRVHPGRPRRHAGLRPRGRDRRHDRRPARDQPRRRDHHQDARALTPRESGLSAH